MSPGLRHVAIHLFNMRSGKNINTNAPYGIRSLAAKLAYAQCRFYPEMVSELLDRLEMMTVSDTSQALLTTRKNILKMLAKNKNTRQT